MTVVEEAGAWGMPVESEGDEEEGKQGGEDAGEPGQDGQSRTVADGRASRFAQIQPWVIYAYDLACP